MSKSYAIKMLGLFFLGIITTQTVMGDMHDATGLANFQEGTVKRLSNFTLMSSQLVVQGSTVSKPHCGKNGVARIIISMQSISEPAQTFLLALGTKAIDTGSTWKVDIIGSGGSAFRGNFQGLAEVYCYYDIP